MHHSLPAEVLKPLFNRVEAASRVFARQYPGESGRRQPVHTVYGGAHLFKADTARRLGMRALETLAEHAPDFIVFARALDLPGCDRLPDLPQPMEDLKARLAGNPDAVRRENPPAWFAHAIYGRVGEKLRREPVEDFRIDFEDGYGIRSEAEEDGHAFSAAQEVVAGLAAGSLPPFMGIRIKPLTPDLRARSLRTLDLFVTALVDRSGGRLPPNFVVTLPKVTIPEQVELLADVFEALERALALPEGSLRLELMVETPQSILGAGGESALPGLVRAARGRCIAAHFGTYDYTAACNITATHQDMMHPACDFARHMMQVALAGTGIWLSDGATNIMPVGPHRPAEGLGLAAHQMQENRAAVYRAWKLHYDHIQHSLVRGFYQGWDLHPAQLPTRYAAVFAFFLQGLDTAAVRLRTFVERAARATLVGDVFDDAATGQGLLNYFLRALNCGAVTEREALEMTGLTPEELRGRSFVRILEVRTQRPG
jgi:citrate lyase beta subunit